MGLERRIYKIQTGEVDLLSHVIKDFHIVRFFLCFQCPMRY